MSGGGGGQKKEKLGSSVRSALNDQLAKLQMKHVAEMDLLDEFRSFLKQRCQLEKEYAQGLQRLAQQCLARKDIKPPPQLTDFDRLENRGVLEVWKLMLTKVEEQGKRRAEVANMVLTSIGEVLKNLRKDKEQQFKVSCEVMQKMISEVLESVKELTASKKVYSERQKMSEEARQKYTDLDERLRKKEVKLFESRSTLEKNHKKSADKLRSTQKRAVAARNEYLLCLAVSNTQLRKHFETDLPSVMKALDGEMYDKVRNAYMLFAQIEADSCSAIKAEFEDLREQAQLVNREYMMECFVHEFPSLRNKILYKFEPAVGDKVEGISKDHGADLLLNKQARYWAQELIKHQQTMVEKSKAIKGLQSVTQAYQMTPEFGTADARAEAQQNMNSLQEEIRHLEVVTTKANARLDALREAGIDVSKWLQQAANSGEHSDRKGSQSQAPPVPPPDLLDVRSLASSFSGSQLSLGDSIENGSENADTQGLDSLSLSSNDPQQQSKYCIALYSYQAQRSDELDIQTDEELEVLEWDDGDGWSRGRNKSGQEGYFPQSYVRASNVSPDSTSPCPPKVSVTTSGSDGVMLRALYDYSAEDEEELSFPEGAIIRLLKTDADGSGVDDGWWEGSYNGKVGVFPSVIVEVISGDPEAILSPAVLTPVASETSTSLPYLPPPLLPPPNYPAPEISAEDLAIGPNLRTFPSMFNADILSGMSSSSSPIPTPAKTSSWPQGVGSPGRLDRAPTLVDESLERTLCSSNRWSSFEDIEDNENESFV